MRCNQNGKTTQTKKEQSGHFHTFYFLNRLLFIYLSIYLFTFTYPSANDDDHGHDHVLVTETPTTAAALRPFRKGTPLPG